MGFVDIAFYPFIERLDILAEYNNMDIFNISNFPGEQFPKLDRWYKAMKSSPEVCHSFDKSRIFQNLKRFSCNMHPLTNLYFQVNIYLITKLFRFTIQYNDVNFCLNS